MSLANSTNKMKEWYLHNWLSIASHNFLFLLLDQVMRYWFASSLPLTFSNPSLIIQGYKIAVHFNQLLFVLISTSNISENALNILTAPTLFCIVSLWTFWHGWGHALFNLSINTYYKYSTTFSIIQYHSVKFSTVKYL